MPEWTRTDDYSTGWDCRWGGNSGTSVERRLNCCRDDTFCMHALCQRQRLAPQCITFFHHFQNGVADVRYSCPPIRPFWKTIFQICHLHTGYSWPETPVALLSMILVISLEDLRRSSSIFIICWPSSNSETFRERPCSHLLKNG